MMRTRTIGITLAGVFGLAACTQDNPSRPIAPTGPSFGKTVGSCAVTTTINDAKAYFADSKDPFFTVLDTLVASPNTNASNAVGFRVLTRLAVAANSAYGSASLVKGDSTQGSKVANDVLGCMNVTGYSAGTDFVGAFGKSGLFAVRGDASGRLAAVISRGLNASSEPLFGAERSEATWGATLNAAAYTGDILFYGYRLPPAATFNGEDTASVVYDLSALPSPLAFTKNTTVNGFTVPVGTLRTGVCDMSTDAAQILHDHSGSAILPPAGEPAFCASPPSLQIGMRTSPFARFAYAARGVASWFAPKPLFAAIGGGGSALVSGLSHLGAVDFFVDPNSGVTFSQQPLSGKLNAADQFPSDIAVQVLTDNDTPMGGVKVALVVQGNSGSFTPPADSVRFTNSSGIATFPNFVLDKAGGYTITATASQGSVVYGSVVSNLFNLTGAKTK